MAPLYSFDPDTSGPGGSPGTMVMSVTCAEWRCGECAEWFRCDHQCHRRQGGHTTPSLADLNAAAERQFGPASSSLPPDLASVLAEEMAPEGK